MYYPFRSLLEWHCGMLIQVTIKLHSYTIIIWNYIKLSPDIASYCTVTCTTVTIETILGYDPFVVPWEKIANIFCISLLENIWGKNVRNFSNLWWPGFLRERIIDGKLIYIPNNELQNFSFAAKYHWFKFWTTIIWEKNSQNSIKVSKSFEQNNKTTWL